MDLRKKTLLTAGLVAVVVIAFGLQFKNSETYKGKIMDTDLSSQSTEKADLICTINPSQSDAGDVTVDVGITNLGPGSIDGSAPFKYAVYIDDKEVFSNTDSYSTMQAGNSFEFSYPISKKIYQYGENGLVKCAVDIDDAVDEVNEENNETTATY